MAYPISGQLFKFVPANTSHFSLAVAKSTSGAPPGPLIVIKKARIMTYTLLVLKLLKPWG
jgi:hypothetical protein